MASYVTGVIVAIAAVFGLYATLELAAGNSLFGQERFGDVPTAELLEMAVKKHSPDRVDAIVQLGKRPKEVEQVFPVLAPLTMERNELIKTAAGSALSEMGEPAVPYIKTYFDFEKLKLADEKVNAMKAEKADQAKLTPALKVSFGLRQNHMIASSCIRAIGGGSKTYLPQIKRMIASNNALDRRGGLFALQGLPKESPKAIDEIIACLADKDFNNQCMACRALESMGPAGAKAEGALVTLLNEGSPSTRGWAAIALSEIVPENEEIVDLIANKITNKLNPIEHQRYINALAKFGPKAQKHLDKMRERLKHKDKFIQCHSAFAVYKITGNADESIEIFKSLIEQDFYAGDALELVAKMGKEAEPFIPSIVTCLESSEPGNRELALVALANIGPPAASTKKKVERLLDDDDALVRIAARTALNAIEPPEESSKQP